MTSPLEDQVNELRAELETLRRRHDALIDFVIPPAWRVEACAAPQLAVALDHHRLIIPLRMVGPHGRVDAVVRRANSFDVAFDVQQPGRPAPGATPDCVLLATVELPPFATAVHDSMIRRPW